MASSACKRILIANRGEVACRVIRTCRKLRIESVVIYSEADKKTRAVKLADHTVAMPGFESAETYLNIELIIEIAKNTKADAIHPGYGFLAENAEFAEACEKNGIIFIGPRPETISQMASKSESKELAKKVGLRVLEESRGFPVLVKAVYGGGGKGQRIVNTESELKEAIEAVKRESRVVV